MIGNICTLNFCKTFFGSIYYSNKFINITVEELFADLQLFRGNHNPS